MFYIISEALPAALHAALVTVQSQENCVLNKFKYLSPISSHVTWSAL